MTTQNGTDLARVALDAGVPLPRRLEPPAPLGQEHHGAVEVRVTTLDGVRAAYLVPAQGGRRRTTYTGSQAGLLVDLQRLQGHARQLDAAIGEAVRHGRELGLSWAVLGFSVGLTDNGVKSRYEHGQSVPGEVL